jgi:hypothetical protein
MRYRLLTGINKKKIRYGYSKTHGLDNSGVRTIRKGSFFAVCYTGTYTQGYIWGSCSHFAYANLMKSALNSSLYNTVLTASLFYQRLTLWKGVLPCWSNCVQKRYRTYSKRSALLQQIKSKARQERYQRYLRKNNKLSLFDSDCVLDDGKR